MKRILTTALLMAPLLVSAGPNDEIVQRQELMKETREALKPLIGMARGQADFDAATVENSLEVWAKVAAKAGDLFPEGTETGHETEAKSTIWSDRAGFDKAMADFANAVAEAQADSPSDLEGLQPMLRSVTGTCKGCHDNYRVEKED